MNTLKKFNKIYEAIIKSNKKSLIKEDIDFKYNIIPDWYKFDWESALNEISDNEKTDENKKQKLYDIYFNAYEFYFNYIEKWIKADVLQPLMIEWLNDVPKYIDMDNDTQRSIYDPIYKLSNFEFKFAILGNPQLKVLDNDEKFKKALYILNHGDYEQLGISLFDEDTLEYDNQNRAYELISNCGIYWKNDKWDYDPNRKK